MRLSAAALCVFVLVGACRGVLADGGAVEAAIAQCRTGKPLAPSDLEAIESCVVTVLETSPEDERALFAKALLDRAKGEHKKAKSTMEALVKKAPAVAEYRATYGTLCFETINDAGTFEKMSLASTGRAEYEKAIELDSTMIEPRVGLGRFYLMAPGYAGGSYRKAEEQATALIALPDGKGEMLGRSLLADIYADKGDWKKVEEQYRLAEESKVVGASPSIALRGYAMTLLTKKKDPVAALVVIERYQLVAAPDDASPWFLTGEAKRALGDNEGAIAGYTKTLEINPGAVNSRYSLAELLEQQGRYQEAAAQYKEFATRFPTHSRAGESTQAAARCLAKAK